VDGVSNGKPISACSRTAGPTLAEPAGVRRAWKLVEFTGLVIASAARRHRPARSSLDVYASITAHQLRKRYSASPLAKHWPDVAFDEFRKSSRKFLSRGARFRPSTDAWGVG
jgi:hypothetical protein